MSIKRIFIVISAIFAASAVFADNSSVTSKKYVDDLMSGYQGKLPGSGANTLMIYDNSEDGIGEKSIAATLGSGATSVPTVGAVKTGLDGVQDTITGTAGYVMTGTGNPGSVGERAIYGTALYSNSLVSAETVNTSVTNAVNSSLIRVDENGTPSDTGTLWEINTDVFALGVLPSGYTQLEWIESDGTQYIDTGITPQSSKLQVNFKMQSLDNTYQSFFGAVADPAPRNGYRVYRQAYTSNFNVQSGSNSQTVNVDLNEPIEYQSTINNGGTGIVVINGSTVTINGGLNTNFDRSMLIFTTALGSNGSVSGTGALKLWSFQIIKDNEEKFNGIPAKRDSDGVLGIYNIADSNPATAFHTNVATSGSDFTAGPVVGN